MFVSIVVGRAFLCFAAAAADVHFSGRVRAAANLRAQKSRFFVVVVLVWQTDWVHFTLFCWLQTGIGMGIGDNVKTAGHLLLTSRAPFHSIPCKCVIVFSGWQKRILPLLTAALFLPFSFVYLFSILFHWGQLFHLTSQSASLSSLYTSLYTSPWNDFFAILYPTVCSRCVLWE